MSDAPGELIFVYGSLRRGGPDAFRMEGAEFVAPGLTRGKLFNFSGLPSFVRDEIGGFVAGDLYRLSADQTGCFDFAESLPERRQEGPSYRKTLVQVRPYNLGQREVDAWVWEWSCPFERGDAMDPGDWLYHQLPRPAPWLTGIAVLCLLFFPVGVGVAMFTAVGTYYHRSGGGLPLAMAEALGVVAVVSPWAGLAAAVMAHRRRERWASLRRLTLFFLILASIPLLIVLCQSVGSWIRMLF